jgi:hypothetical protein
MLNRIFPRAFDNNYRGSKIALWLFVLITLVHTSIALVAIFRSDGGAQSADGIPLDQFGPAAAQTVIGVLAFLGLASLSLCVLFVVALLCYRSMIPLLYTVSLIQWLAHKGIGQMKPIPLTAVATGQYVSFTLLALTVIGLVLSLTGKDYLRSQESARA